MTIGKITQTNGEVFIKLLSGEIKPLQAGDIVETGDIVYSTNPSATYTLEHSKTSAKETFVGSTPIRFDPANPNKIVSIEELLKSNESDAAKAQERADREAFERKDELKSQKKDDKLPDQYAKQTLDHIIDAPAKRSDAATDVNTTLRAAKFAGLKKSMEEDGLADEDVPMLHTTLTISGTAQVNESDGTIIFTATIPNPVNQDVTFRYTLVGDSATAGEDFVASTGIITIPIGATSANITIALLDDYIADNAESFRVVLSEPSLNIDFANPQSIITIADDSGDVNTIDSTDIESTHEIVQIKLIALSANGEALLDASGNYRFANSADEGASAKYMALAFAPDATIFSPATKLAIQSGSVDLVLSSGTAAGAGVQNTNDGSQDFNNTPQSVNLGEVVSVEVFNDYMHEAAENFTIYIVNNSYSAGGVSYENVAIDTNSVTTTITDSNTITADDKVFVKLTHSSITSEGGLLSHTVSLVDKNGNSITLPAGESITVTIGYANGTNLDSSDYAAATTVVIAGLTSSTTFTNQTHADALIEQTESYTATITAVAQSGSTYEAVAPFNTASGAPSDADSVSGTILDGVVAVDDTLAIAEGGITTAGNLLSNDQSGVNAEVTTFTYTDETGATQVGVVGVATNTLYGTITLWANGDYTYISDATENHSAGDLHETISYTIHDVISGRSDTGNLLITLTDTAPTAIADTNSITEDAAPNTTAGNVITTGAGADTLGADSAVVDGVRAGSDTSVVASGSVGSSVAGSYGSVNIGADGSYTYTLNNASLAVQGLTAGESLTDTFVYTIKDSDGDVSTTTLAITINGADDGVVVVASEDYTGTSGVNTDQVVYESGLATGSSPNSTNITSVSTFTIKALDGLFKVEFTVGGATTTLTVAEIEALGTTHKTITTTYGTLELGGYTKAADGTITINYTYTLATAPHISGTDTMDNITIKAIDTDGDNSTDTLSIKIMDDAPSAINDFRSINEGANTITGNVVTGAVAGDSPDHGYADALASSPIVKVMNGAVEITLGARTETTNGYITINADGSYVYEAKSGLNHTSNADLVENFIYTIQDGDGDESSATLHIDIKDLDATISGGAGVSVDEDDLASGSDTSKEPTAVVGTLVVTPATDAFDVQFDSSGYPSGLTSGGVALVYAISGDGHTLSATAGAVTVFTAVLSDTTTTTPDYTFTLFAPLDHVNASGENSLTISPKVKVVEHDGSVATTTFAVTVTDDVPLAQSEANLSTTEGGAALSGMVNLMANDIAGADGHLSVTSITYKNESNADTTVAVGAGGVTVDTINGTLTVKADGSWSFTSDASVSNPSGVDALDTFTYTIKDFDGDISSATQTITIADGADPDLSPQNQTISETALGSGATLTPATVSQTLGIIAGTDAYTAKFSASQADLGALNLTSGGTALTYTITDSVVTAKAGSMTVFTATITNASASNAGYDFKLFAPLDHTKPANDTSWDLPLSVYVVDSDGDVSAAKTFTVAVLDSDPLAGSHYYEAPEDGSVTFRLSQDAFSGGVIELKNGSGGFVSVASGGSIDVYDGNHEYDLNEDINTYLGGSGMVIGSLKNNGDGTLTFTPKPNYSDYGSASQVMYKTTDSDGDFAVGKLFLSTAPITDAPTWATHSGVVTNEDIMVALNLTLPTITDNADQNGAASGDHGERLGYITLASIDNGVHIYKGDGSLLYTGNTMTIAIVDGSGNIDTAVHYSDLNQYASGVVRLTQAEFATLQALPATNKHNDIDMTIRATSYEVNDSGEKLVYAGKEAIRDIHIEVLAITDPVDITFDNNGGFGTISTTTTSNDTLTQTTPFSEGATVIDLKAFMSSTSGTISSGDLDGSEIRSYTVSGIPEGSVVTLGGVAVMVATGATSATVNFPDNSVQDPEFTLTLPEHYSGTINARITLSVHDTDSDSTTTPATITDMLFLNLSVTPVADSISFAIAQSSGLEDAGRSMANSAINTTIDQPQNGIPLHLGIFSDDKDGSETYTVRFAEIPEGASMYYNGILVNAYSSSGSGLIVSNYGLTWQLEIKKFANTTSNNNLTFIPPLNSNGVFDLKISGKSVDLATDVGIVESSYMPASPLSLLVDVRGVADVPINTQLHALDSAGATVVGGSYAAVAHEDDDGSDGIGNSISLSSIYASGTPDSFDNSGIIYNSEKLTIIISGLPDGFDVTGAVAMGGSGTARQWIFEATDIANVKITTSASFSGEVPFTLKYITTENDGNSKTHPLQSVTLLVTPEAEATISSNALSVNEDTLVKVNFTVVQHNSESGEVLDGVWIKASDVTSKDFALYLDSSATTNITTLTPDADGYYELSAAQAQNLFVKYNSDIGSADTTDGSFVYKYTTKDSVNTVHSGVLADTSTQTTATYSLSLHSVTDAITAATGSISATNNGDIAVSGSTITVNTNTTITVPIVITAITTDNGDQDIDGSEKITRLEIDGVPQGVGVVGGYYAGDVDQIGNDYTQKWYLDIADIPFTTSSGGVITYDLQLFVSGDNAVYTGNATISVMVVNQDAGAGEVGTTTTFNLNKSDSFTPNPTIGKPMEIDDTNGFVLDATFAPHEDGAFSLADASNISVSETGATANTFSITIYDLQNATLSGNGITTFIENGKTIYTLHSQGTPADIQAAMQNLIFTPTANLNANDGVGANVKFSATLTTYADGGTLDTAHIDYDHSLSSVTDSMNVTASELDGSALGHTNEDSAVTFKLNLSTVDDSANDSGVDYAIVGNIITLTHSGVNGTLTWNGGSVTLDSSHHTAIIAADKLDSLTFTPAEHEAGTATFAYSITHQETNAPTSQTSTGSFSIVVDPVADGIYIAPTASGNEDSYITLVSGSLSSADSTESIKSITISNVPNGFLVFYGDSNISANNAGGDGTTNSWVIPVNGANPKVSIKAPENYSGSQSVIVTTTVDDMGSISTASQTVALTILAVADTLSMLPTKAIGAEGEDIPINLNAMAQDLDDSETMTLILKGMGVGATFKEDGIAKSAIYSSADGGTYTISGIDVNNINKLTFNQIAAELQTSINITAQMIESSTALGGIVQSGSFSTSIVQAAPTSSDDTLRFSASGVDGLGGSDTLVFATGESVDFTALGDIFHNIEKLDLSRSGDHTITMNSEDARAMNSTHSIEVSGDTADTLNLKDSNEHIWIKNGSTYTDINDNTTVTTSGFDADIVRTTATTGDDIIGYDGTASIDGLAGNDRVVVLDGAVVNYNNLSNIETIDLSKSGTHTLSSLSLDTIFTMTDSAHTLTIEGDSADTVMAVDKTGWSATVNNGTSSGGFTTYEYQKASDIVTLKIDNDLHNQTNLA